MPAAWARLLRAGELTAVYVPESTDEAIRDLCRARTDAVDDHRRCRHRLKGFLLRHGFRYQGKANWSQPHMQAMRSALRCDRNVGRRAPKNYSLVSFERTKRSVIPLQTVYLVPV